MIFDRRKEEAARPGLTHEMSIELFREIKERAQSKTEQNIFSKARERVNHIGDIEYRRG